MNLLNAYDYASSRANDLSLFLGQFKHASLNYRTVNFRHLAREFRLIAEAMDTIAAELDNNEPQL